MTSLVRFTDQLFDIQEFFDSFFCDFNYNEVSHSFDGFPITNVYVNEDRAWKLEMALAGWSKDAISIEIEDGVIIIKGDNSQSENDPSWKLIQGKIKKSNFERRFRISTKLDIENAKVDFGNGILTIIIPAKEEAKPRKLEIK